MCILWDICDFYCSEKKVCAVTTSYLQGRCSTPCDLFLTVNHYTRKKPAIKAKLTSNVRVSLLCTLLKSAIFLHIPNTGIFLEGWRTGDKDRRSRRLWSSPLYPFGFRLIVCYSKLAARLTVLISMKLVIHLQF